MTQLPIADTHIDSADETQLDSTDDDVIYVSTTPAPIVEIPGAEDVAPEQPDDGTGINFYMQMQIFPETRNYFRRAVLLTV